ncbi:MAG TPA: hypothetical protein VHZ76_04220, partial [Gammaproteobacteria bacterium]|nr:hypothetical protein [Gammaproteobacteria bacterium]
EKGEYIKIPDGEDMSADDRMRILAYIAEGAALAGNERLVNYILKWNKDRSYEISLLNNRIAFGYAKGGHSVSLTNFLPYREKNHLSLLRITNQGAAEGDHAHIIWSLQENFPQMLLQTYFNQGNIIQFNKVAYSSKEDLIKFCNSLLVLPFSSDDTKFKRWSQLALPLFKEHLSSTAKKQENMTKKELYTALNHMFFHELILSRDPHISEEFLQTVLSMIKKDPLNAKIILDRYLAKKRLEKLAQKEAEDDQRLEELFFYTMYDINKYARTLLAGTGLTPSVLDRIIGNIITPLLRELRDEVKTRVAVALKREEAAYIKSFFAEVGITEKVPPVVNNERPLSSYRVPEDPQKIRDELEQQLVLERQLMERQLQEEREAMRKEFLAERERLNKTIEKERQQLDAERKKIQAERAKETAPMTQKVLKGDSPFFTPTPKLTHKSQPFVPMAMRKEKNEGPGQGYS